MALNTQKRENNSINKLEEEYTTNKVLFVVAVCFISIFYLMILKHFLSYGSSFMISYNFVRGVGIAAVIGIPIGQLKWQKERRSGIDTTYKMFSGKNIMFFCAMVAIVHGYITYYYILAIHTLYFILPGIAILYLIYHVYQREFFIVSLDCALAGGLLWVVGKGIANPDKSFFSLVAILTVALIAIIQIILVAYASKHDGYITTVQEPSESARRKSRDKWKKAQFELSMNEQMRQEREKQHEVAVQEAARRLEKAEKDRVPLFTTSKGSLLLIITPLIMLAIHLCAYYFLRSTYGSMLAIIAYFFVSAIYYTVKIL